MADDENLTLMNKKAEVPQPLFAAATSLFPSAASVQSAETVGNDRKEDDLGTLKLNVPTSTLDAILAAQSSSKPKITPEVISSSDECMGNEDTRGECAEKRKASSDSEDQQFRVAKKKKRHKESGREKSKKKKHKKEKRKRRTSESPEKNKGLPFELDKIAKGKIFLEEIPNLKPEHAYRIDRKSNRDLWHYKSLSKMHIAKYKPFVFRCLGDSDVTVFEKKSAGKEAKKKWKNGRYFGKDSLKTVRRKSQKVDSKPDGGVGIASDLFIKFSETVEDSNNTHTDSNVSHKYLDEATALYIQGKGLESTGSSELTTDSFHLDDIFEKVGRFNQRLREEPHNVKLWLEFVRFQDVVAQEDKTFHGKVVRLREEYQPSRAVIDKKISILGKALEANPSSLELQQKKLDLCRDIWDSAKLEKAWEDLLFAHSGNVDLWWEFLSRQQSLLSRFSFSQVLKTYHKCFSSLVPIAEGQVKVVVKSEHLEEKLLGLFAHYCQFLHQSGYTERAVSSFQTMVEFNLFCPSSFNLTSSKQRAEKFEAFWDSPVPKFGEPGAQGWAKWVERGGGQGAAGTQVETASTEEEEDAIVLEGLPRFQTWLKMERVRQDAHWLPWKPDEAKGETEESCEDLDRLVLYEDIIPAIFRLSESRSCVRLVCLFLRFLGVTIEKLDKKIGDCLGTSGGSQFEQYAVETFIQVPILAEYSCGVEIDSKWKPHSSVLEFVEEIIRQAEAYFISSNRTFFTLLKMDLEVFKHGVSTVSELSKSQTKEAKKFWKNILKESQNRSNLVVWDAYVRLLWASSEKMSETVSMVETALGMFLGSSSVSEPDKGLGLCLLCKTYSQIMLNFDPLEHVQASGRHSPPTAEDKKQVLVCLGALVENKSFKAAKKTEVTPAFVLKLRKRFENTLSELCSQAKSNASSNYFDLLVAFVDCFALFEFAASNLQAANNAFSLARQCIEDQNSNNHFTSVLRNLYLSQISLIKNVMCLSCVSLAQLRSVLMKALNSFPEMPRFHVIFFQLEAGAYIAGRLRKFYEHQLKDETSVVIPLCAVLSEMARHHSMVKTMEASGISQTGIADTGSVHRIRSVLDQSLQKSSSSHCPLLWRLYLHFEVKYGNPDRAKGIFYRALQSCPWAKSIYLDGISVFGNSELQEVSDLMTEKEIRVRIPLEEVDLLLSAEKEEPEEEVPVEELPEGQDEDKDRENTCAVADTVRDGVTDVYVKEEEIDMKGRVGGVNVNAEMVVETKSNQMDEGMKDRETDVDIKKEVFEEESVG